MVSVTPIIYDLSRDAGTRTGLGQPLSKLAATGRWSKRVLREDSRVLSGSVVDRSIGPGSSLRRFRPSATPGIVLTMAINDHSPAK